jgi:protein-disulfide isomerase
METLQSNRLARLIGAGARRGTEKVMGCLMVAIALSGCSDQKTASAAPARTASAPSSEASIPEVLATIGDERITMQDIRARVGDDLDQLESRYRSGQHKLIESTLQDILRDRVLLTEAKKQGKTVDQLIAAEAGGSLEPSEIEISAWYQENQARTGGRALEQIRPQIADYLRKQRRKDATDKLDQRLNKERNVTVNLEPFRVTLDNDRAPAMGPADAKVTLVEFSDFQCPFCGRFFSTLKQVEDKYAGKVRIVYRQYPIPSLHANALKAAEASLCANEQGKFWELHDLMFQEQNLLTIKDLKTKAGRLGLDQKKFDSCLDTGHYAEQVQEDMKEGGRVGVTGTPALFVNGVPIDGGAVGLDVLSKAIDKELARSSR